MASEYDELQKTLSEQGKKIDRLLAWAEGDPKLGTPSIKQQLLTMETEVIENRKRSYENRNSLRNVKKEVVSNKDEIDDMKKVTGKYSIGGGIGGGSIVTIVWNTLKSVFQ